LQIRAKSAISGGEDEIVDHDLSLSKRRVKMKSSKSHWAGVLLVLLVSVGGCRVGAVRMNQQAQIYYNYGEYAQAERILKESLDIDHENAASRYWLGRCYESMNQTEKAIYQYGLAVRYDPAMDVGQTALIRMLYRHGRKAEAMEAAQKYLSRKSGPMSQLMVTGKGYLDEGMEAIGLLAYRRAQEVAPHSSAPSMAIAEYYFSQNNEEEGIKHLIAAFEADPFTPGLAKRLGELGYQVTMPEPPMWPKPTELELELRELD